MAEQIKNKKKAGFGGWIKEKIRKMLVALKKNPQIIPILALTVSFVIFSFNLTDISNTTAKIYGPHMGLCAFISMLLSILSYVCMFSAFPKRKKPNMIMVGLLFAMYIVIIIADVAYYNNIVSALTRPENPIQITDSTLYILEAKSIMIAHIISVVVTIVCVALEPVFAKLFRKIKTSIEVEDNGELEAIDLGEEE